MEPTSLPSYREVKISYRVSIDSPSIPWTFLDRGTPTIMVTFSSDSGDSKEHAVKIMGARNGQEGILAEYWYLSQKFGERGKDWNLALQSLLEDTGSGRVYDQMDLDFPNQPPKTLYFDITEFYRKL